MARKQANRLSKRRERAVLNVSMTESALQTEVVKRATEAGWLHHELTDWIYALARFRMKQAPRKGKRWPIPGWPDLFLIQHYEDERKPRRIVVMELKSEKGQLRDAQKEFLRSFAATPIEVYCLRPHDLYDGTVDHILNIGPVEHEQSKKDIWKPYSKKRVPLRTIDLEGPALDTGVDIDA